MNWKKITVTAFALLTITACGNTDENAEGQRNANNIEPIRNEGSLQAPMRGGEGGYGQINRNRNNTYDGTYQRGQDLTADEINYDNRQSGEQNRNQNNQNYDVSEKAAQQITEKIDQIDQAYVLKMGNNAYVAAELDQGNNNGNSKVTKSVKKQIAEVVKQEEYDVDYVYVSTNPDFVNLTTNYADDMANGEPVEGFFDQMGEMIQRIFPRAQQ
ncbi:Lipoprotein YhcN precursor [Paraliobacillus sp. PM-2]|uniref:YhcN/YlaJ family sporulation lipoprotein n=1 Tax=Paraliobacillus sp. PM-2 TaxID=1462524 RepID=UPI00061CA8C9|nr:YhcN/YlaJ family sporulation lipoprotein [Paraliobacillus sp. PM-2]CQR47085.1 Lipoprotein YhcN precursor [Paraliobacillus sp. PM-2]